MSDAPNPSLWLETTPPTEYAALAGDVEVDACVVGAGIAGVTAAVLLKRGGKTVALVDAKRILRGATGYTTAKVTAGHNLVYTHLRKHFGEDGARTYATANQAALERIARFVDEERIDCDFERRPNFVYAESEDERSQIADEVDAARGAGLDASLVTDVGLPYPVVAAARLDDQAQFNPRKYLLPLAASIPGDGSHVFELTRVTGVRGRAPLNVVAAGGSVRARDVVLATHLPILDRGLFFAKSHPSRSYAVAARIEPTQDPGGMYINISPPTRSVRTARDDDGFLLLLGGEGHKPGAEADTQSRYAALEEFGRRHWGATEFPYRWSTQDYQPADKVPYVGRLTRRSQHLLVATGFNKWGMTNGTAAAMILADAIVGRPNPWAPLFDAKRIKPRAAGPALVKENAAVATRFFLDRVRGTDEGGVASLRPGEGRMVRVRGRKAAVYRDESGALHALSPVCRHLGCHVGWNPAEQTWDCPCHGSRYAGDGRVIQGPAVEDLKRRPLPEDGP